MKTKYIILIGVIIIFFLLPRSGKIFLGGLFSNTFYQIKNCLYNNSAPDNNLDKSSDPPSPQQGAKLTKSLNYMKEMDKKDNPQPASAEYHLKK